MDEVVAALAREHHIGTGHGWKGNEEADHGRASSSGKDGLNLTQNFVAALPLYP
jgi:hypothetical protein